MRAGLIAGMVMMASGAAWASEPSEKDKLILSGASIVVGAVRCPGEGIPSIEDAQGMLVEALSAAGLDPHEIPQMMGGMTETIEGQGPASGIEANFCQMLARTSVEVLPERLAAARERRD